MRRLAEERAWLFLTVGSVVRALTPVRQFIMMRPSVASTRKAREHSELDQSPVLSGAVVAFFVFTLEMKRPSHQKPDGVPVIFIQEARRPRPHCWSRDTVACPHICHLTPTTPTGHVTPSTHPTQHHPAAGARGARDRRCELPEARPLQGAHLLRAQLRSR